MDKGESRTIYIEGGEYLLTRCLDYGYTLWGDNKPHPYRLNLNGPGGGECDCPDYVIRRKQRRELCKHLRALRRELGGDSRADSNA